MINVYNVRLDESTVEGLELVKRKEGLDTIDDVCAYVHQISSVSNCL